MYNLFKYIICISVVYVTGFAKTVPNHTRTEIQLNIKPMYTLALRTKKHQTQDHRWPGLLSQMAFANLVKPPRCTTGSVKLVNGCKRCQTAVSAMACGLSLFLLLTEDTALLSVY